ncbi:polysaccharide lyase family 14 protein [Lyophyllum atratum]|nr:polysaccharide lyase family 14 protein [Lyophyllum atratum]
MFRAWATPSFLFTLLAIPYVYAATQQASVEQIVADYGLSTSTSLPFPSATQASIDAQKLMVAGWSLGKGAIQDNPGNLAFVADPFPNKPAPIPSNLNLTGPVLRATYPQGSFSSDTGGSQWYNLWNTTAGYKFQTMLVSYEVAFDEQFDWVKGGKLPGLRGSTKSNLAGCSSGKEKESNTTDCFSTRLMWRRNGGGEVYAHIPTTNGLCSQQGVTCSTDTATTIQRGSFGFVSGQWNRISLLVRLNDPPNVANGNIQLYYNDLKAIDQQNLQIRTSSQVFANGFYFSTFFGGSDKSWETPREAHTYYRGIRMWGSSVGSNLTGNVVSSAGRTDVSTIKTQLLYLALGLAVAALFI